MTARLDQGSHPRAGLHQQAPAPALELRGAGRIYRGAGPAVIALRATDLALAPGGYTSIVGPSGSGKSTLLNLLGLLDQPDSGDVLINGRSTRDLNRADLATLRSRTIAFVFQAFHLLAGRTALENVALGLTYQGVSRKARTQAAYEALERVGLGHRLGHEVSHLSGGERQRVAIARAMASQTSILLCDEPTGNLDQASGRRIMDLLRQVNAQGTTVVAVTHDSAVAEQADHKITVTDGSVQHG